MLFNSYIFIFLFLPASIIGFYGINFFRMYRIANLFLIGMSLWFYGYFHPSYVGIICASIAVNFLIAKKMDRGGGSSEIMDKKVAFDCGDMYEYCSNILF